MKKSLNLGQPGWTLATDTARAHVTQLGGMVGPVEFRLRGRTISPYAVAPWAEEKLPKSMPPLLQPLRGDFFCLPFGHDPRPYRGELYPVHGETANRRWRFAGASGDAGRATLRLTLATRIRRGRVTKEVALEPGQTVVYQNHRLEGMRGPMSGGYHAMLRFPAEEGSGRLAVSPFRFGQVWPVPFEDPAAGGYQALVPGARFTSLTRVPRANGGHADLSRYPARAGFEDAVMLATDPGLELGWTTVTFSAARYVWFSLKNPRTLRHTVLWMSNGGRHYAPWNGRHRHVLGLEEVTAMPTGLRASVAGNAFSRAGLPTHFRLDPKRPTELRSIHGVAAIPAGFDVVAAVTPRPGGIELRSASGRRVFAPVNLAFLG